MSRRLLLAAGLVIMAAVGAAPAVSAGSSTTPVFTAVHVSPGGFEPRIAIGPDGTRYDSTQDVNSSGPADLLGAGAEVVYASKDGGLTWQQTPASPSVTNPCCDNEIAISPTGRILSSVIDFTTININIQYSDDGGKTWTQSLGNSAADQDREWLTVGTKDPVTGMNDVYMLWHNLASGAAHHEMMVSTSRDNGATFGPPISITAPNPGSPTTNAQANADLQCADSGGPSNIFANPVTGQVYAVWGTRSSSVAGASAGGCGASVTGPFEINIVAATRVWVATSSDQGVTWKDSLAADDSTTGQIVGMQVNAGALDDQGNVYVTYPESPNAYPDYDGAAVKYTYADANLDSWAKPVTVAAPGGAGHILTHIAAGDPGKLSFFYLAGAGTGSNVLWYPTVAQTYDGRDAAPQFLEQRVSDIPAWKGTASQLMGVCDPFGNSLPPPFTSLNGGTNGLVCGRSSDVLGQAIDAKGFPTFTWDVDVNALPAADAAKAGTYVVEQTDGPALIAQPVANTPEAPVAALLVVAAAAVVGGFALRRRRHRTV